MKIYRLGACLKCRGDLAYDQGDWICLQCGVYYYTGLYAGTPNSGTPGRDGGLLRIARITHADGSVPHAPATEGR